MYSLNEKAKGLKAYDPIGGDFQVRLDANESFLPLPEEVLLDAQTALPELAFNRYPDPAAKGLCAAFARHYGVPEGQVVAGNGSDELITVIFSTFLEKGDAFATLEPDFSMYAFNGFLQEARHVPIQKGEGLRVDIDETIRVCEEEGVKLLIFSNPCNPTSLVCPKEEVARLIRSVSALVVLDEAYMDFSDQSLLREADSFDNLIILRTCSKAFGMAALRLGFAVARPLLADTLRAAKSPYNVNALSQKMGALALGQDAAIKAALEEILLSRDELAAGLEELGRKYPGRFTLLPSDTNFCALLMEDRQALFDFLCARGIAIRLTGGLVRITCGTPEENRIFLRAAEEYFKASGKGGQA